MDISRPIPANRPIVRVPQFPRLVIIKSHYASCIYVSVCTLIVVFLQCRYGVLLTGDSLTLSQVRWGFFRRGPNCRRGTDLKSSQVKNRLIVVVEIGTH